MKRVLIACGGSGGHIFPGLSIASELKKRCATIEIFFICTQKAQDIAILSKYNYKFKAIPAAGLNYPFLSLHYWKSLVKLFWGFVNCFIIIRQYQPDLVVGFGGYLSVPVIIIAFLLKIPALIHEQNFIPGLANRFLGRFVKKIALTFKETAKFFHNQSKIILTGNPLHPEILKTISRATALNKFGFSEGKFTILVMGGSLGSHKINQTFAEMFASMDKPQRESFQIIHITGSADYESIQSRYREMEAVYQCFSFLEEINCAYKIADLVIARAGANTISEISHYSRLAILVPHPNRKIHQKENALALSREKAAVVIFNEDLTPVRLKSELLDLVSNQGKAALMRERAGEQAFDGAAVILAEAILEM